MSPLYTFRCPEGHEHDALGAASSPPRACPECARPAERLSVYSVSIVGEASVPLDEREVRLGEFQEAGEELAYAHERAEQAAGKELPGPSLWNASKRAANELMKKGVQDSSQFRGSADGQVKYRSRWLGTNLVKE